jgi:hypothetical protein
MLESRRRHLLQQTAAGQQVLADQAANFAAESERRPAAVGVPPQGLRTPIHSTGVRALVSRDGVAREEFLRSEHGVVSVAHDPKGCNAWLSKLAAGRRTELLMKSQAGREALGMMLQEEPPHPATAARPVGSTISNARKAELMGKTALGRFCHDYNKAGKKPRQPVYDAPHVPAGSGAVRY